MNLNKAMIIGNLTRDPETRTTPNGKTVAQFGVATNRVWSDAAGVKQQDVEYHNIVAWGKLAEICGRFLAKGRKVYIEGRLKTRDWVGQDGVKRNKTEIICDNMILLDKPPAGAAYAGGAGVGQSFTPASAPQEYAPAAPNAPMEPLPPAPASIEEDIKVEDIPF